MKYLIPIFALFFMIFPAVVMATCEELEADIGENTAKICYLIEDIRDILYALGLSLAVIIIIISGIMYMTAGADESKAGNAKKTITYGLIGAAIILLAGFIINLLDEVIISAFLD